MDPAREQAAWEIARRRRLLARPMPSGRWKAFTGNGEALEPAVDYADPVEALEGAEAAIAAGELRDAEIRARRLFAALARGEYVPIPTARDADGSFGWRVRRVSDQASVAGPYPGLLAALREIARLVGEPVEGGE